jgi:hypothetical protein
MYLLHMIPLPGDTMVRKRREIAPDEKLRECEVWQTNIRWPVPVDTRLNALIELAEDEGESLTRSDLVAALVCAAPTSGAELGKLLKSYRTKRAGDIAIGEAEVVPLPVRKPGRRS